MRFGKTVAAAVALMCASGASAARYYEFELKASTELVFAVQPFSFQAYQYDITMNFVFDTINTGQLVPAIGNYQALEPFYDLVNMSNNASNPAIGNILDMQTPDGPGFSFNFSYFDIVNSDMLSTVFVSNDAFSYRRRVDPRYLVFSDSSGQITSFKGRTSDVAPSFSGLVTSGVLTPVPEPTTWAMLIIGFGAIGTMARRRNRALAVVAA